MENLSKIKNELKDFYIPYRDSLSLPDTATFGLEIEFNIKNYVSSGELSLLKEGTENYTPRLFMYNLGYPKIWKIVSEIENRIEIVSDVLNDNIETWNTLKTVLDFIKNNGFYYNGFGGSHVHAFNGIIGNDIDAWITFLKIWASYEEEIIRFTNGEFYFDRIRMKDQSARCRESIYRYLEKDSLINKRILPHTLCDRSHTINFCDELTLDFNYDVIEPTSEFKEATIEYRCPQLTVEPVIWQNNVNFFIKMMLACKNKKIDIDLLNNRYNNEIFEYNLNLENINEGKYFDEKAFELSNLVFDNDLDKYCFLRQYFKDFNESVEKKRLLKSNKFWK